MSRRYALTLAEQETSSSQAPYHSLPRKRESSLAPLLLLSPQSLATLRGPQVYDNELLTASIYTHDPRMINKLRELAKKYPDQFRLIRKGPGKAVTYEFPKRCFGIRPPYSETRKKQQAADAKTNGLPFLMQKETEDAVNAE